MENKYLSIHDIQIGKVYYLVDTLNGGLDLVIPKRLEKGFGTNHFWTFCYRYSEYSNEFKDNKNGIWIFGNKDYKLAEPNEELLKKCIDCLFNNGIR